MRWPVRIQLLLLMLGAVGLGIVLTSLASAYLAVREASRYQAESLDRVVRVLTAARYPLSQPVLEHVSGLSGAQFVVVDAAGRVLYTTIPLKAVEVTALMLDAENHASAERFSRERIARIQDREYFVDTVPRVGQDPYAGVRWLVVLYPREQWGAVAWQVATPILLAGIVTILCAILVAAVVAGRFVRPIRALRNQSESIAGGSFQPIDVPKRNDEFADLTRSINSMAQRLSKYETEVRRNERMRTLGQLGVGMAHQLRNAATGARMALELIEPPDGTPEQENTGVALRQLQLMESYLQRFVAFGRHAAVEHTVVELGAVVTDVVNLVRPACGHAKVSIGIRQPPQPIHVPGERDALVQLVMNLVLNALEAAERPGCPNAEIIVELAAAEGPWAELRVLDTGAGPAAEVAERLFEPFVTGKPDGTGLGLYYASQVVEAHRGTIDWQRHSDRTCFTVRLPAVHETR